MQIIYTHEYNKRLQLFKKVVEILVIRHITSIEIDKVEEHISDNEPLWTNESEMKTNRVVQRRSTQYDPLITQKATEEELHVL
ncbi:hypothetical protein Hanom_Chr03g00206241 [Helianthus anomalus]